MEKQVLELFEAAKTAADTAASLDGGAEAFQCIEALNQLKKLPLTPQLLLSTQVGRQLWFLRNHPRNKIRVFASELLETRRKIIIQETANQEEENKSLQSKKPVEEEPEKARTSIADKKVRRRSPPQKVENKKGFRSPTAKVRKTDQDSTIRSRKQPMNEVTNSN